MQVRKKFFSDFLRRSSGGRRSKSPWQNPEARSDDLWANGKRLFLAAGLGKGGKTGKGRNPGGEPVCKPWKPAGSSIAQLKVSGRALRRRRPAAPPIRRSAAPPGPLPSSCLLLLLLFSVSFIVCSVPRPTNLASATSTAISPRAVHASLFCMAFVRFCAVAWGPLFQVTTFFSAKGQGSATEDPFRKLVEIRGMLVRGAGVGVGGPEAGGEASDRRSFGLSSLARQRRKAKEGLPERPAA